MDVFHSHLDLNELGFVDSYEISGEAGSLEYEFPPMDYESLDGKPALALVVLDGGQEGWLTFELNEEPYKDYTPKQSDTGITAIFPEFVNNMVAKFSFPGKRKVKLHFAIFRRIGGSFSNLINKAINRFKDKCWACKRLVKFLVSLILSGGIDDMTEAGFESLWNLLWQGIPEDITGSKFGEMLEKIIDRLNNYVQKVHPGNIIADAVCRELNYCEE